MVEFAKCGVSMSVDVESSKNEKREVWRWEGGGGGLPQHPKT